MECSCRRPYIGLRCEKKLAEATFGHEANRSYAQVVMTPSEQMGRYQAKPEPQLLGFGFIIFRSEKCTTLQSQAKNVEFVTDISMLIRTRNMDGTLLFIGSEMGPRTFGLDTFITAELRSGQLKASVKLGSQSIVRAFVGPRLDDGFVHLIRLYRRQNHIEGYVNDTVVFKLEVEHPFDHPLLVTHFFIGGYPLSTTSKQTLNRRVRRQSAGRLISLDPEAFTTTNSFKGVVQDVRINGKHVPFFPTAQPTAAVPIFGRAELHNAVLQGTVSDDTCGSTPNPCSNDGQCQVTFNDYDCHCKFGWIGKNCTLQDHCTKADSCPVGATCRNRPTGYTCLTPATFDHSSSAKFSLSASNARPLFRTVSFRLRTRTSDGELLRIGAGDDGGHFLLMLLKSGNLALRYRLSNVGSVQVEQNLTRDVNLTDGQWHEVKLTLLTELSSVLVDKSNTSVYLASKPTIPLHDLLANNGTLLIGGKQRGFKGCINEVRLGNDLPPASFYPAKQSGQLSEVHLTLVEQRRLSLGCQSDEVCRGVEGDQGEPTCKNGATCLDLWNAYQCQCSAGFDGRQCQINIDDCPGNRCGPNGHCLDGIQRYSCRCNLGFTGTFCDADIDECSSSPCRNGGECVDQVNGFECRCDANYTGQLCQILITVDCASSPCQNGAECRDVEDQNGRKRFSCACRPGYTGRVCESEINYCTNGSCVNGGACSSITEQQDYTCRCQVGYTGKRCETEVLECASNPCLNGAVCQDQIGSFFCNCSEGWTGERCEEDVNECETLQPCRQNATCTNLAGDYSCACPTYFLGKNCELVGSCVSSPCLNGDCVQESVVEHSCRCRHGYTGSLCDVEINFCSSNPCMNAAECSRTVGGFTCLCRQGYTGSACEVDIDECASSPCSNGGTCTQGVNKFTCTCSSQFTGPTCAEDIDECQNATKCLFGDCTNIFGTYRCRCREGYIGRRCAHEDPCLAAIATRDDTNSQRSSQQFGTRGPCRRGTCVGAEVRLVDGEEKVEFSCRCPDGYTGQLCDTETRRAGGGGALSAMPLSYIAAAVVLVLVLVAIGGGCLVFFLMARSKRATRGTYSPSRQEMTGARLPMNHLMKKPPEERLI